MPEVSESSYEAQKAHEIRESRDDKVINFAECANRIVEFLERAKSGNTAEQMALNRAVGEVSRRMNIPQEDVVSIINESLQVPMEVAICNYLQSVAKKVEEKSKYFGTSAENCNLYATEFVSSFVKELTGISPKYPDTNGAPSSYVAFAPVHEVATASLRGIRVADLTEAHFAGLPAGLVFFVNVPEVYVGEYEMISGTFNKLPTSNILGPMQKRHWFTFAGLEPNGKPVFIDNLGHNNSLSFVKGHFGGRRVVVNVFDPLARFRENLVVLGGKIMMRNVETADGSL